jgi:hypothetical protein
VKLIRELHHCNHEFARFAVDLIHKMPPAARRPATTARSSRKRNASAANDATSKTSPEPGGGESESAAGAGAAATNATEVESGAGAATATTAEEGNRTMLSPPLTGGKSAQAAKRARVEFDAEAYAVAMELVKAGRQKNTL